MNDKIFSCADNQIMTFRVYDSWGTCISEFTGTLLEWQNGVAVKLAGGGREKHLRLVK